MDEIVRASWKDRFWAWLIDVLLVEILWSSLMAISPSKPFRVQPAWACLMALLFVYWTVLEGYREPVPGKDAPEHRSEWSPDGERIGLRDSPALESLGKAFLAPAGLSDRLGRRIKGQGQRAFNKLSNTDCRLSQ
ncbi:MAG: hypothetical protein MZU95_05245 [Desulfomicrobium escambiense]|nr:hypothetical protein [Desulfomicrobium escambiense]